MEKFPRTNGRRLRPGVTAVLTAIGAAVCAAAASPAAFAGDWPQFRGPTGLGYTDDAGLPLAWGGKAGENVLWKAPLPKADNGYSSPVVSGGRVFLTVAANNPVEHRVLCFAEGDGKPLWDAAVEPGPWKLNDLRGGYGAPSPAADADRVFVVFGSAVVACLDARGKLVWRKELPRYQFDVAMGSSPILYKDTVILLSDQNGRKSSLVAFDKKTGDVRWEEMRPTAGFNHSTPALAGVNGKPQLLVSASNALQGVDPDTGKVIWWCANSGESSSPAFGDGLVYCDSGRGGGAGTAVDPTGAGDVSKTHVKWKTAPGQMGEGLGSGIVANGCLYRLMTGGKLFCFKTATGELLYNQTLPKATAWSSPVAAPDGTVYFASAGTSYVVKAGPKLEILATNDLGDGGPPASPAVADGKFFLRGAKFLWCVGKAK